MRLEIAERMRCPRPHEATSLVVVARRIDDRELIDGVAGCPACAAEFEVRGGDVYFGEPSPTQRAVIRHDARDDRERLDRLMALLMLAEPGGALLLSGGYARFGAPLVQEIDVAVLALRPTEALDAEPALSTIHLSEDLLPFSDETFRAAAIDDSVAPALAAAIVQGVAVGGRVVGANSLPLPPNLRELARDASEWVAEREPGSSGVVRIRRA